MTRHVRKEDVPQVMQQIRNYRRLQKLIDRWITLAIELARLKIQAQHEAGPEPTKKAENLEEMSKKPRLESPNFVNHFVCLVGLGFWSFPAG